jgi:succinate-acetate transporter protein
MNTPKINQHIYRQFQFDFDDVQRPAERYVEHRTFADAGPLGLCAFAATLLLISLINLRADNVVNQSMVIGMGISSLSSSETGKL